MAKHKISYEEALEELEGILKLIEDDKLPVDELTSKVKRASELLDLCKKKLSKTETDVEKILSEME